jgi:hypothetical protein
MIEFIVVFYVDGIINVETVKGFDIIGVTRKITKKHHIHTIAVVSVSKADRRGFAV